ncbi:MAG TPA: regulatory protein RecX [Gemmatimonadales bacterium]|nr:regulatory protein RecX [Gemmatimonadales bacterium]
MPVLTSLAPDPRQPGYQVLEVDRGRFASLPVAALAPLGIARGETIAPPTFSLLQELADIEAAYRAAVRAQTRRPHARAELRRRLMKKQHPGAAVDAALERLAAQELLDDRRFAEHFVATRAAQGRGSVRLLQDLRRQGVDQRVAEAAVAASLAAEGIDESTALRRVAERRARQLGALPQTAKRRRLLAYLARRGYRGAEVRKVVEQLISETEEPQE